MQDRKFGFRVFGRDHGYDDANCSGCESIDGKQYPRSHKDFGTNCLGLVHAERFVGDNDEMKTVLACDICFANPKQSLRRLHPRGPNNPQA